MSSNTELQSLLEKLLNSRNVYFQPPPTIKLNYPAIIYELDGINQSHANDEVYNIDKRYSVTLIDANPNSKFVHELAYLPKCRFNRHFKSDNLNHYVFTLYY